MNQLELATIRRENSRILDPAYKPSKGVIFNSSETLEHFIAKAICYAMLKSGVPDNMLPNYFKKFQHWNDFDLIDLFIEDNKLHFAHKWQIPVVITEAIIEGSGRWDLFNYDTGRRIEIVKTNSESVRPYDEKTIVVDI